MSLGRTTIIGIGSRRRQFALICLVVMASINARPQTGDMRARAGDLPAAPQPGQEKVPDRTLLVPEAAFSRDAQPIPVGSGVPQEAANVTGGLRLSRVQAEQLALKNNPRISAARLLALAQHQVYRQARSQELPDLNLAVTAVDANEGSLIGAGTLNAPRLLEHAGAGVALSQLLADFGRTSNLVSSSKLLEKAQNASALATTEDIILATDQAFYKVLEAQSLLRVAQQTVTTRQSVENQINTLTQNKLKSTLDLTFAQVNLSQAKLLQLDAQNNVESTIATLTAILGLDKRVQLELSEDEGQSTPPPLDVDSLINTALQQRPDLLALNYDQQAAEKYRRAQHDSLFPTIRALGVAGVIPVRPDCFGGCFPNYFISSWYGAIGVNMSVPIFDGFLLTARASEAKYRAQAAAENVRDLRDSVVRDVRTAWLATNTAFQRVTVSQELAKQTDLSLSLAQQRYQLGLGSIVELSQAQLQQTDAAIAYVNAQYQYRLALSTLNFQIGVQP